MTTNAVTEAVVENAMLGWFRSLGYSVIHGPTIVPGEPAAERDRLDSVLLTGRLRDALIRLNADIPVVAIDEALRKVSLIHSPSPILNNRDINKLLRDGVAVEYTKADGTAAYAQLVVLDPSRPALHDFLAVNQVAVIEGQFHRRADVVVYVNGIPLAVIELKNPSKAETSIKEAWRQLQTYGREVPGLFHGNALLVISDGLDARAGAMGSDFSRFLPWRTVDGVDVAPPGQLQLETLTRGIFDKARFLELVTRYIVFEDDGKDVVKKIAAYHQFHAVRKAVDCTVRAASAKGDRRIGVVWHTQGSGKSLTMVFFAGCIARHPAMANPTLIVLTDRNDLDEQLFGTFAACSETIGQKPVQAGSRTELRTLLNRGSGGVIFTTIQKFSPEEKGDKHPLLSDRRNIVVIADEAHRSQYDFLDGYARHLRDALPAASFIGFTGTPIEASDKSTAAVFGNYIDVYDIQRAVDDGATVKIYYESRLAKLRLKDEHRPTVDADFEDITEGEESTAKEALKSKWARLEAMVGTDERIRQIAADIVEHFDKRCDALTPMMGMPGKGIIVTMSRRIAVDLYNAIIAIRPNWHDPDDKKGVLKVVMTGQASDPEDWQQHIRSKKKRKDLADRYKKADDPFRLVIVRDMWLTGFDAPCAHTMYVDKPMQGHGLMQAIARVNRVFGDKPGGLIVDYLGLAAYLRKALHTYTESGGKGETTIDQAEAVELLKEKHEVVCSMFHGFKTADGMTLDSLRTASPAVRFGAMAAAMNHVLGLPTSGDQDGKTRYNAAVMSMSKAFALSVPHPDALALRDDVCYFQAIRAGLLKASGDGGQKAEDYDSAIRQIVSQAVSADGIVDIYAAAGLKSPDISILSDEFLAEIKGLPHRNLALELLRKLLNEEVKARAKKNLVQSRSFSDMLEHAILQYQNRAIEAAEVIERLIELAKEMRAAKDRNKALGLTDDETAFYEALEVNDSAVKVLGEPTLKIIAHELVEMIRANVSIDWTEREAVKARLRAYVRRILRRHGYPPDKQEKATQTVLEQAELLAKDWAA